MIIDCTVYYSIIGGTGTPMSFVYISIIDSKVSGHLLKIREIITFLNTRLSDGILKLLRNYFLWEIIREIIDDEFEE